MAPVVKTTNGKLLTDKVPGTANEPLTKETANQLADEANKKAEALGIKTRYEVHE